MCSPNPLFKKKQDSSGERGVHSTAVDADAVLPHFSVAQLECASERRGPARHGEVLRQLRAHQAVAAARTAGLRVVACGLRVAACDGFAPVFFSLVGEEPRLKSRLKCK